MLAALDETYPELAGGIAYVVAATVLVADEDETRAMLAEVLDAHGRTRPFHWHSEGPLARSRMLQCLEGLGAIAHVCVHYPTRRKRIEGARALCLRAVIPKLIADGSCSSRAAEPWRTRGIAPPFSTRSTTLAPRGHSHMAGVASMSL